MPLVKEQEIGPCEGVRISQADAMRLGVPHKEGKCNNRMPLRIKGFDDRWRCEECNRVHAELVFLDTKFKGKRVHT